MEKDRNVQRDTTKTFVEKAIKVHKERYRYEQVVYIRSTEKVLITCSDHGPFSQRPRNHLMGQGCPKCYDRRGPRKKKKKENWQD